MFKKKQSLLGSRIMQGRKATGQMPTVPRSTSSSGSLSNLAGGSATMNGSNSTKGQPEQAQPTQTMAIPPSIDVQQLEQYLRRTPPVRCLFLDLRPPDAFAQSHVLCEDIINLPPSWLSQPTSASALSSKLPLLPAKLFDERQTFELVVYYDARSTLEDIETSPTLRHLMDAIHHHVQPIAQRCKRRPVLLNGGFEKFRSALPLLCSLSTTSPTSSTPTTKMNVLEPSRLHTNGPLQPTPPRTAKSNTLVRKDPFAGLASHVPDKPSSQTMRPSLPSSSSSSSGNAIKPLTQIARSRESIYDPFANFAGTASPAIATASSSTPLTFPTAASALTPSGSTSLIHQIEARQKPPVATAPLIPPKPTHFSPLIPTPQPSNAPYPPSYPQPIPPRPPPVPMQTTMHYPLAAPPIPVKRPDHLSSSLDAIPSHFRASPPAPVILASARNSTETLSNRFAGIPNGRVGLKNMGNTCYMNSVLQCLSGTPPIARWFLDGSYKKHLPDNLRNVMGTKGEVARAFDTLIRSMWYSDGSAVSAAVLKVSLFFSQCDRLACVF